MIVKFQGKQPKIDPSAFIAENAMIISGTYLLGRQQIYGSIALYGEIIIIFVSVEGVTFRMPAFSILLKIVIRSPWRMRLCLATVWLFMDAISDEVR